MLQTCWILFVLESCYLKRKKKKKNQTSITADLPPLLNLIQFLMVHLHSRICILFHRKYYDFTCLSSDNVSERGNSGTSKGVTNHLPLLKQLKYWRGRQYRCTIFASESKVHQASHLPQFHPSVSILLGFHSSEEVMFKCAAIMRHYPRKILFIVKTVTECAKMYAGI